MSATSRYFENSTGISLNPNEVKTVTFSVVPVTSGRGIVKDVVVSVSDTYPILAYGHNYPIRFLVTVDGVQQTISVYRRLFYTGTSNQNAIYSYRLPFAIPFSSSVKLDCQVMAANVSSSSPISVTVHCGVMVYLFLL